MIDPNKIIFAVRAYVRRPYFAVEFCIAMYLVIFILLTGGRFGKFATLFGLLGVIVFCFEALVRNQIPAVIQRCLPLIPLGFFVLHSFLILPLIPYATPRVQNNFTGFLFFVLVFFIYRKYGRSPLIEGTLIAAVGIITLRAVGLVQLFSFGLIGGRRIRYSGIGSEAGDGSTGASTLSVYVGIAFFFGVREIFINRGFRERLLKIKNLLIAGCLGLGFILIVGFSGSRQGLFWIFLAVAFVGAYYFRKKLVVGVILSIPAAIVGLVGFVIAFRETTVVQRFLVLFDSREQAFNPERSAEGRLMMIERGLELWQTSPLWGIGNEGFRVMSGFFTYSHNNYIELLTNYGIIGIILYYSLLIFVLIASLRRVLLDPGGPYRAHYLWVFFAIGAVFVSNLFVPGYYMRHMITFTAAVCGYLFYLGDNPRKFLGQEHAGERSAPPPGRHPMPYRGMGPRPGFGRF
jgi:O-antigen ligase